MAEANKDFVIGFICVSKISSDPSFLHMTPGKGRLESIFFFLDTFCFHFIRTLLSYVIYFYYDQVATNKQSLLFEIELMKTKRLAKICMKRKHRG